MAMTISESALRHLPDTVLHIAASGRVLAYHRGVMAEELNCLNRAGHTLVEMLPQAVAAVLHAGVQRALLERGVSAVIFALPGEPGDGELRYCEARFVACDSETVLCVLRDITERRRTEQRLIRRELYLAALTQINHRLLSTGRLDSPYTYDTLAMMGYAAGAGVAYAVSLAAADEGNVSIVEGQVWRSDVSGPAPVGEEPARQMGVRILPRWVTSLRSGRPVQERLAELAAHEQRVLSRVASGAKVLLLLPVMAHDRLAGILGFENHSSDRSWPSEEVDLLHAAAVAISSYIERDLDNRQLKSSAEDLAAMNIELAEARDLARASDRVKSEFLAVMGHETRTPLNAVISMTEMLLRTELSDQQRGYVDLTHEAGISLLDRINAILDYVEVEAGPLLLHSLPFNPAGLVQDVVRLYREKAGRKALKLAARSDPDLPAMVRGDAIRLRQALIALVDNAVKFTEQGGVVVRVALETPDAGMASDRVALRFSVTDTGIGLAPDAEVWLYEPFSQADGSSTRRYNGSGLGLAMAKRVVASLGGNLAVHSTLQRGSTFWFVADFALPDEGAAIGVEQARGALPLADAGAMPRQPGESVQTRVLLVEGNAILRRLAMQELERQGCQVLAVAGEAEALRALMSRGGVLSLDQGGLPGIDILLLDVQAGAVPRERSVLVASVCRTTGRGQPRTLLVGMVPQAGRASQEACDAAGVDLCLTKPLTAAAIRDLLARGREVS